MFRQRKHSHPIRLESVAPQPMANRRAAHLETLCDLPNREPRFDKGQQILARDATSRGVSRVPDRVEPMLLEPVRNR
jgi:hypothetical protein